MSTHLGEIRGRNNKRRLSAQDREQSRSVSIAGIITIVSILVMGGVFWSVWHGVQRTEVQLAERAV